MRPWLGAVGQQGLGVCSVLPMECGAHGQSGRGPWWESLGQVLGARPLRGTCLCGAQPWLPSAHWWSVMLRAPDSCCCPPRLLLSAPHLTGEQVEVTCLRSCGHGWDRVLVCGTPQPEARTTGFCSALGISQRVWVGWGEWPVLWRPPWGLAHFPLTVRTLRPVLLEGLVLPGLVSGMCVQSRRRPARELCEVRAAAGGTGVPRPALPLGSYWLLVAACRGMWVGGLGGCWQPLCALR